jgi:ubiquinone/menaquinone biosynthesis C-methylase UbiE
MTDSKIEFHPLVAALYDPAQAFFERYQAPEHRTYLAEGLDGEVLEIGVGTGAMVPYYETHAAETAHIHGVEPDPGMYRRARDRVATADVHVELTSGRVESLPYEDDAFDYVLECGLCCSVPSVETALAEIERVLAPDGEFRFLDHVRSAGVVGRSQDLLTPLWRSFGGNCHLDREVEPLVAASDLTVLDLDHHTVGYWPIREFVRGRATPTD